MDPDAVADAFTRTGDDGNVPGIMQSMKTQLDRYAGLTGATKGILVEQAGTPLSSLSLMNNTLTGKETREKLGDITFVTATDGNHGRGVAWTAKAARWPPGPGWCSPA